MTLDAAVRPRSGVPAGAAPPPVPSSQGLRLMRRMLGALLALTAVLPVYRLLQGREVGVAGEWILPTLDLYASFVWTGLLLALPPALLAARFLSPATLERWTARVSAFTNARSLPRLALAAGLVSALLTALFTHVVLEGKPSLIDAMAQLLHARFWAASALAGPVSDAIRFWHIQNSVVTPAGWVSQYPPGHVLLLALGFRLGAVWAVGPVLMAITVVFTALAARRLMPERPGTVRLATVLLALSPFLICLAGAFMNHITSAAFFALSVYCAVRSRDGGPAWAVAAGAALAYAFAVRPLSALAVGGALCVTIWLPALDRAALRRFGLRLGLAFLGALPLLIALLVYNAHFFGGPFTFGYSIALGPAMSLGFHRDPWGNMYGPVEALAYTGSDLLTLGVSLLETPVSALLVVGVYLLAAPRLETGVRVFAAWALVPVAANALYWHHGIYMGPRMLLEAGPGWIVLAAVAGIELCTRLVPARRFFGDRWSARSGVAGGLVFATLLGIFYLAPERARTYGGGWISIARIVPPPVERPSLVFVHDAWVARLAMRLAAAGMPLDSVETMMRQNPTCVVQNLIGDLTGDNVASRRAALDRLDLTPRASGLPVAELAPGDNIRVLPGVRLTGECARQAGADRGGILDIAPLLWQGDLPGQPAHGALYVRDLGPAANDRLIATMPEREPLVFFMPAPAAQPALVPYAEGMRRIWGEFAAAGAGTAAVAVPEAGP